MENYVQLRVLGKGSFGSAWLIQRKRDGVQFVAKEVRLAGMKPAEQQSARHEVAMLRTLDHPNVTRYVDHFELKGSLYIVMEYANGGDLYTKIKSRRGQLMTEKEVLHYFCQLCLSIMHLHEKRILHRDLKTQNVFLTQDGVVKLGDFGISTVLRNTYELKRTVCGTPYYFSPELCLNKPYNNKSDVWAMGCILYELTTLNHAFDGTNMKALVQRILKGVYPPIHSSYSRDLAGLISSMLQIDPAQRPNVHQIVALPFIRTALAGIQSSMAVAARDHISCVSAEERAAAAREAAARAEQERVQRERRAQEDRAQHEEREREHQRRIEAVRAQMAAEMREHEEKLRRVKEQQNAKALEEAKNRREFEERMKAKAKEEAEAKRKRDAQRQVANRQREEEWERNMKEQQRQQQMQGQFQAPEAPARGAPPPAGYDPNDAARVFREMRREAEANRLRAAAEERRDAMGAPAPRPRTPPDEAPPLAGAQPIKKQLTPEELEAARKDAYWQMRREAEANKRRLLGLDPLPAPAQPSAPQSSPPLHPAAPAPVVQRVHAQPPPHVPAPQPVVAPIVAPIAPRPAQPVPAESESDDDEDAGVHRFLNNEAAAGADPQDDRLRDADYRGVDAVIANALSATPANVADFEDAADADDNGNPDKFFLEGQTIRLPNVSQGDPLGHRIESLRLFLEHSIGEDNFVAVYRILDRTDDNDMELGQVAAYNVLPKHQHKYVHVIMQLIVCEQAFMHKANFAA